MNTRTGQILFTEDDVDSCEMLAVYLESAGYVVTWSQSPAEAIRFARQCSYDLILVDNWMPEMSGLELTREIRKFDASTPILFYSGAGYESDKKAARDSGAQGYLVKPDGIRELVNEVARLIAESKLAFPFSVELHDLDKDDDYDLEDTESDNSKIGQDADCQRSMGQRMNLTRAFP